MIMIMMIIITIMMIMIIMMIIVIIIISTISSTEMDAGEGDWKLSIPTIKKRINWRRKGFMSGSDDN
jgi:hypothetical protein